MTYYSHRFERRTEERRDGGEALSKRTAVPTSGPPLPPPGPYTVVRRPA